MMTAKLPAEMVERAAQATALRRQERERTGGTSLDYNETHTILDIRDFALLVHANIRPEDRMITLTLDQFRLIKGGFTYPEAPRAEPAREDADKT